MTSRFPPEGRLIHTPENKAACATRLSLAQAMESGTILEGMALLCDSAHDLTVALGPFHGVIPRQEAALGIAEGTTRDIAILSRVGKPVCFMVEALEEVDGVLRPRLSRCRAQQAALKHLMEHLEIGQVIPAAVTHLEPFGAFVDVGCGVTSLISIENISISRIPHPAARFQVGQEIYAAVQDLDPQLGRIYLTHRELLGTWSENAAPFQPGMTVPGIVRGVKEYGVFVELAPNLSGLAEYNGELREGDRVSVYIKAILPQRMKIKLLIIDTLPADPRPAPLHYFITDGVLKKWKYAPEGCSRIGGETIFASS